jgi:transcriptional regulator with XRE-family HTH domain
MLMSPTSRMSANPRGPNRRAPRLRAADRIEMHRAYYGALENGKKNLQLSTLERVCEGLGVAMSEVIQEAERL